MTNKRSLLLTKVGDCRAFSSSHPQDKTGLQNSVYGRAYAENILLKVNVEISTFNGRSQGLPRGRNISSSIKGRIVLPL